MGGRAGLGHPRGGRLVGRHAADADGGAVRHGRAGPVSALSLRQREVRQPNEGVEHRIGVLGHHQQVDRADGLAAAPDLARQLHLAHVERLEVGDQAVGGPVGLGLAASSGALGDEVDPIEDPALRGGAEALQASDPAALRGRAELLQRLDPQLLVERADALRPEPGDAAELDDSRRGLGAEPVVQPGPARLHELPDNADGAGAQPGDLRQLVVGQEPVEVAGCVIHGARGGAIGADPERLGVLQGEECGDLLEDEGRHRLIHSQGPAPRRPAMRASALPPPSRWSRDRPSHRREGSSRSRSRPHAPAPRPSGVRHPARRWPGSR